jgi:hypothetical protein
MEAKTIQGNNRSFIDRSKIGLIAAIALVMSGPAASTALASEPVTVIYEKVTVSKDGNSFSGTGAVKGYSGIDPFDPSATTLYTFPINITGKRVIPDPSQLP